MRPFCADVCACVRVCEGHGSPLPLPVQLVIILSNFKTLPQYIKKMFKFCLFSFIHKLKMKKTCNYMSHCHDEMNVFFVCHPKIWLFQSPQMKNEEVGYAAGVSQNTVYGNVVMWLL